ncbi:hypothetical protein V1520DRAFT_374008 [Lipomyces starkeyi]|uniref:Uncharacterized protein n=1 Tax=Lipomyces starkeyi NRRL Y-11557 TaxID=675824 RepID=A0A1E3PVN8_LIPST|nr:hypothetical protein LIPSTDRAFT_66514 [Lipomyces starkeyi NRRL Y-11557]
MSRFPDSELVCAKANAGNVAPDDPNHDISGVNMEVLGTYHPDGEAVYEREEKETMMGFVTEQASTYKTDHIPVFAAMAEKFFLFDRWFAAVPGPTNPNRAYLTSEQHVRTLTSGKWKTNIKPIRDFNLRPANFPPFTYINPECCSYDSFRPPSPISTSEGFMTGIYEALRGSHQWNETLFILTFDEHGGFGDHVRLTRRRSRG